MHIFHKWGKWEQYKWVGQITQVSTFIRQNVSLPIKVEENRQRRTCEICGKMQDEEI